MPPTALRNEMVSAGADDERRVRAYVRTRIEQGDFAAGDRLPAQMSLAKELSVSRHTVRRALETLERDGLLEGDKYQSRRIASVDTALGGASVLMNRTVLHLSSRIPDEASEGLHQHFLVDSDMALLARLRAKNVATMSLQGDGIDDRTANELMKCRPVGVAIMTDAAPLSDATTKLLSCWSRSGVRMVGSGELPAELPDCIKVDFDHEAGGAVIVDRLVELGRRRLLRLWSHMGLEHSPWLDSRNAGVEQAASRHGLTLPPAIDMFAFPCRPMEPSQRRGWEAAVRMVIGALHEVYAADKWPDAIICTMDYQALVVNEALKSFSLPDAQRPLVVGYDNIWRRLIELGWGQRPPDLSVDKDNDALGERMAEAVLADRHALSALDSRVLPRLIEPLLAS